MAERSPDILGQSSLYRLTDEAFLRLQAKSEWKLGSGDVLAIPGKLLPYRSGTFYVLCPNVNRPSYLIIHYDWFREKGRKDAECLFDSWEVDPGSEKVSVKGRYSECFAEPPTDHQRIIRTAQDNSRKNELSEQPCWELLDLMARTAGQRNAIFNLAEYAGSDAEKFQAVPV